jgi:hypothetical protein
VSSISGNIDHKDFQDRLSRSSGGVLALAEHFHCTGFEVRIPSVQISPERSQNPQYIDDGDLWIKAGPEESELRIEVKWSRQNFVDSWPYPLMWVMDSETWDKMVIKPYGVFTMSHDCLHAGLMMTKDIEHWVKKESYDKVRRCTDLVYACPVSFVKWVPLKRCKR